MTQYAKVVDGQVLRVKSRAPRSTEHISNFHLMSDDKKKEFGRHPVVITEPDLKDWQSLSSRTYTRIESSGKVENVDVIVTVSLDEYKTTKINEMKLATQLEIEAQYPPYKQRSAALGIYTEQEVSDMKSYINTKKQSLDQKESQILAASDYDSVLQIYQS